MVVPECDLVIATHGDNYGDKVMYGPQEICTPKYISPPYISVARHPRGRFVSSRG